MKTAITDTAWRQMDIMTWSRTAQEMRNIARKLELDRASLMEALKACLATSYDGPMPDYARDAAAAALSAARANFPDA